ncbi:dehydratase [Burkholderia pseudomallei MSHR338]|uniref:MaoC/PaaZ C-terminal domain-containing protein n=1 Tax=Burkholderia pseudomallei TaxID=28450 RepID=UPI0003AC7DE7|nr:MaoC/PaaZ C-terminal domain-containing protein [Burkholderia pseudomallei]AIP07612.1 monoamine oxidase regulatory protein, putative [Burkholderia pseudomallei]EQA87464.1 dehydratase [Burkholderia pseudomallei MSHR338]OMW37187.1 dehydratase [Burkholderia pseudomallei]ONA33322.1 dehydratase [Burkholderia pseudomallei]ONA39989.1 dehydratase [Burkholderia pseudomallei]
MNFLSRHYDEIEIGERFESRGRTVTETDIVQWCALTGDWYVLHTDAHYAARTRFGQRVAPGLLVHAIAAGLGVPADAPAIVANYGTDGLRFTAPTFIGDTVRLRSEVLAKTDKRPGRNGVVKLDWKVYNQNDELLLTSDLQILMTCRGRAN